MGDTIELSQYARKFDEDQLDGSILLNDCDKSLLSVEMGIKPLHVGKILREVNKLREINKDELQDSYKDWNELIEENKKLLEAQKEQDLMIKDLQTENAELRLKSINSVNPQNIVNPMADDRETTQGFDLNVENYDDLKTEKIQFAENAATEIGKLNTIIKVLSNEYTTLSTPYYKKFNPVDSIIRSLGYTPKE